MAIVLIQETLKSIRQEQFGGRMLSALIERFEKLSKDLVLSVRRGDETDINMLDARLKPLTRRIFDFRARNCSEVITQIGFFNQLCMHNSEDDSSVRRYTAMVAELSNRYRDVVDCAETDLPKFPKIPLSDGYDPSVQDMILDSVPERVAVVSRDYRYIYCNQRNADFHDKRPCDFIGKHMVEMIGVNRFQSRAGPRIDQCFSGASVSYTYEISDRSGQMFEVDCRMTPMTGLDKSIAGAIIILTMQPMFASTA
ncbi:PAS domain-containing protein [Hoeflea sp. YIM 152468]|uniref:PAS domain-containing protein n=1 Tax=Hoeflea sp. YIM 152468 TaxID=3031759 RepID=UPI0023DC9DD7|nr:PAS domain-containing protein [Hoeflea sp. YIM 152468]